jgi:hypothetical protein
VGDFFDWGANYFQAKVFKLDEGDFAVEA